MLVDARGKDALTLKKPSRPVKLRDLLTHTSGVIGNYPRGLDDVYAKRNRTLAETTVACVELIRPLAAGRNIQLHCELAPAPTHGDTDRISQVITNLLSNAVHYNRDGGEIRVTTHSETAAAVLTVSDTGPGIAPEDLPRLFERFFRADKSRTPANGRNGLGLAISKAIVAAHGGSIEVTSETGRGSCFTVRLPAGREQLV